MKRWIITLVPIAVIGALVAWRLQGKKAEAAAQNQQREQRKSMPATVTAVPASIRDVVETFEGTGTVESPFNVKISPKVAGRIDYLEVREGDRVTAGQVLVRLDPAEVEAQVQQQRAALAEARSRLAQATITQAPTNASVQSQIRQQEAEVSTALADQTQVEENSASRKAAMRAAINDAIGRVNDAEATINTVEASIRSAQANLNNAKSKLSRMEGLYKEGFIAAQDVEDARTNVTVYEGALDEARSKLNAAKAQKTSMEAQKEAAERNYDVGLRTVVANKAAAAAKVKQAKAGLQYARANVAQTPAYRQNLAALQAAVQAAEASVRSAEARRADTVLRAPFNGSVAARSADPGMVATPGQPVLTLLATNQLWVNFPVPEEVSRNVTFGMPVTVQFDAMPDRPFAAKVVQVNPAADVASRQFTIRAGLGNGSGQIKPGMFARVKLETGRYRGAIVVPREAVQQGPEGATVTVVTADNKAEKRPVTVGASDAAGFAITSGLQAGEKVVTVSASPIKDGAAIRLAGAGRPGGAGARGGEAGGQPATR